tara:strand:- start:760 stop:1581 length:822 start_codon:yes stop_codon:yes gene_type:complete
VSDAFKDLRVIITGASSGLGAALAEAMAVRGAHLTLFARREAELGEVAARCRAHGGSAKPVVGDVTSLPDCERLVQAATEGGVGIDLLVASAGVSMWARFDEIEDPSVYAKLMETNYLGVVYPLHHTLPHLKTSSGTLVAISSIQGKIGVPLHSGYVASKHAVVGFLAALRQELKGSGVNILTVMPHWLRGTDLRANAYAKDGDAVGEGRRSHSRESISLEACSEAILEAIRKRKRELVVPWKLRALPWLNLISPGTLDRIVSGAVKAQDDED